MVLEDWFTILLYYCIYCVVLLYYIIIFTREMMSCGWGVKVGMVREWVAGKAVWSRCYHGPYLSVLAMGSSHNRALYKCPITLLTYFTYCRCWSSPESVRDHSDQSNAKLTRLLSSSDMNVSSERHVQTLFFTIFSKSVKNYAGHCNSRLTIWHNDIEIMTYAEELTTSLQATYKSE